MTTKKQSKSPERAVLVTTKHRGVFFGYTTSTAGDIINLRAARCCIYWPSEQKGFMGLAATGPLTGARIGPAADMEVRDITAVLSCTAEAIQAWEKAPWSL